MEIVDSFNGSDAAKGLRVLGASIGSIGQYRVTVEGRIPKRIIEHPDHPDNTSGMWSLYRMRSSRPYRYGDQEFEDLDSLWKDLWENVIKNSSLSMANVLQKDLAKKLKELGVDHTTGLEIREMQARLDQASGDQPVQFEDVMQFDSIQKLAAGGWRFTYSKDRFGILTLNVWPPIAEINVALNKVFPPFLLSSVVSILGKPNHYKINLSHNTEIKRRDLLGKSDFGFAGTDAELDAKIGPAVEKAFKKNISLEPTAILNLNYDGEEIKMSLLPFRLIDPFWGLLDALTRELKTLDPDGIGQWTDDDRRIKFMKDFYETDQGNIVYSFILNRDQEVKVNVRPQVLDEYRKMIYGDMYKDAARISDFYNQLPVEVRERVFGDELMKLLKVRDLMI